MLTAQLLKKKKSTHRLLNIQQLHRMLPVPDGPFCSRLTVSDADAVIHYSRGNLCLVPGHFVGVHLIIGTAYRCNKQAPTPACLEEGALTELNETCPLCGSTREPLISQPATDD